MITHFEGNRVDMSSALPPLVGRIPANSDAAVRVVRDGKTVELIVNIGELPNRDELQRVVQPNAQADANVLKLHVQPLNDEVREQLGVDKGGVLISRVVEEGPAAESGIVVGDVLLMVDNKAVDTPAEFAAVVAELAGRKSVAVLVQRAQGPVFLALKLDE